MYERYRFVVWNPLNSGLSIVLWCSFLSHRHDTRSYFFTVTLTVNNELERPYEALSLKDVTT
jgi:hypothetical protein